MDYFNYIVEDFIADESFQRYCQNRGDSDVRFWIKWKADHPHKHYEIEQAEHFVRAMQLKTSPQNSFDYALRKQAIRSQLKKQVNEKNKQLNKDI